MPRLRKLRKKQKYQYHVNRRKLNMKMKKLPRIECDAIRKVWDDKKSLTANLDSMGLVADPNTHKGFRIPTTKEQNSNQDQILQIEEAESVPMAKVAMELEEEAKEGYRNKREVVHTLPPQMVKKLINLLNKHGEDFDAMAKDHTNYFQETAGQLRSQVKRLKQIPQQWIPYLRSRGVLNTDCENVASS